MPDSDNYKTPFERITALENRINTLEASVLEGRVAIQQLAGHLTVIANWATLVQQVLMSGAPGGNVPVPTPAEILKVNPDVEVPTANGKTIKLMDVPLDASGWPTEEWALENCTCEIHTARRAALNSKGNDGTGFYL